MSYLLDRNHEFLFSLISFKKADSARLLTIRRLYDVCMYSLYTKDIEQARKAFGILLRCKEFNWKTSWSLAIYMLNPFDSDRGDSFFLGQVEHLRSLMLQAPVLDLLNEILQVLVLNGRCAQALEEIELYLPSFPFQDNPVLHVYAGAICLRMSQDPASRGGQKSPEGLLEEAKTHFTCATQIDPKNCVAHFFLDQISLIQNPGPADSDPDLSGDEVSRLTQVCHISDAPKRSERGERVIERAARQRFNPPPPRP